MWGNSIEENNNRYESMKNKARKVVSKAMGERQKGRLLSKKIIKLNV